MKLSVPSSPMHDPPFLQGEESHGCAANKECFMKFIDCGTTKFETYLFLTFLRKQYGHTVKIYIKLLNFKMAVLDSDFTELKFSA